jgi:hypothetical protein
VSRDPRRLLGGWAADSLTGEERQELLRAALEDQSLFDALVEEDGLRALLADPAAREHVLRALDRQGPWQRARAWLTRPATIGDLAASAAVVVLAIAVSLVYRSTPSEGEGPAAARPAARGVRQPVLARLAALPATSAVPAWLEEPGTPPRVRPGQALALRFSAAGPARVLVVDVRPNGSVAQSWPAPPTPPGLVGASAEGAVVRSLPLSAPSAPGHHRLRLVLVPLDVDLGRAAPSEVSRLAARLQLADLACEVETP